MAVDENQIIVDMLTTSWNPSNTDSITPEILDISDKKKHDYNLNKAVILVHRIRSTPFKSSFGVTIKGVKTTIPVDIRVLGFEEEPFFQKVRAEVTRIFDDNINDPTPEFDELDPDKLQTDLSNKTKGMWRELREVDLIAYTRARGLV